MARLIKRKLHIEPRFHQTDMMGVIHNSEYFLWFEEGRLQITSEILSFDEAVEIGVVMPVIKASCCYRKPVRYGDPLVLYTTHAQQSTYEGKMLFTHTLVHEKKKTEMAAGETVTTLVRIESGQLVKDWPPHLWERYLALD